MNQIGPFDELCLQLDDRYNLICGTNGIGKTSLLNVLAALFCGIGHRSNVKKNSKSNTPGTISCLIEINGNKIEHKSEIDSAYPSDPQGRSIGIYNMADSVIFLNTDRDFQYKRISSITPDPERSQSENMISAVTGIKYEDIKDWIVRRYIMHQFRSEWPKNHVDNFNLAQKFFSIIDPSVSLSKINHTTFDVMVNTPYGMVMFEQLSSGFRAIYSLLLGILKEIEIRRLEMSAEDFNGIIIIDELDMHLHPTWQQTVPSAIQKSFPNAQIIVSSHSPFMIQCAQFHEVIALVSEPGRSPKRADLPYNEYGFKGWTVEEILEDVMGLESTNSPEFTAETQNFNEAIELEDADRVRKSLAVLDKMLHPNNMMRKLIKIQAAPIVGSGK